MPHCRKSDGKTGIVAISVISFLIATTIVTTTAALHTFLHWALHPLRRLTTSSLTVATAASYMLGRRRLVASTKRSLAQIRSFFKIPARGAKKDRSSLSSLYPSPLSAKRKSFYSPGTYITSAAN